MTPTRTGSRSRQPKIAADIFSEPNHTIPRRIFQFGKVRNAMENQLWNVFRETGDPLGYLLYQAERQLKPPEQPEQKKQSDGERGPSPSL